MLKIVSENFIHALLLFLGLFLKISRWVPLKGDQSVRGHSCQLNPKLRRPYSGLRQYNSSSFSKTYLRITLSNTRWVKLHLYCLPAGNERD